MLMNQAIPLNKKGSLANIIDWPTYKARLIEEFGSINIFGRDVTGVFKHLSCYESAQEVAEDLAQKIKTLQANLEVVKQFQNAEIIYVALTPNLNQYIMKSFPTKVRASFNEKYIEFWEIDPDNVMAPATFLFIAQFVSRVERQYRNNPSLFDVEFSPLNVGVNAVKCVPPTCHSCQPHQDSPKPNRPQDPLDPCPPCTITGFEDNHFPFNYRCGGPS